VLPLSITSMYSAALLPLVESPLVFSLAITSSAELFDSVVDLIDSFYDVQ
ncbi:hypothetical protein BHE74_00026370, partial [Ensete ventricosum]